MYKQLQQEKGDDEQYISIKIKYPKKTNLKLTYSTVAASGTASVLREFIILA